MPPIPPRMSSPTLDLDRASSARNAAPDPSVSANRAGRPPRRPRRSGVSAGRVVAFLVLLAAVAAGVWYALRPQPENRVPDESAWIDLSRVPPEMRPVVEFLHPSPAEAALWFETIRTSTYVQQKWASLAKTVSFEYGPGDDRVNAFAGFAGGDTGRPGIVLCGGMVRVARLIGAISLVQASAEEQGAEKDLQFYLKRISSTIAETGGLSSDQVVDLLNEFEVGTAVFENTAAVTAAKALSDGICKAVLGHEMGHIAGGHARGADPNRTVSKNEEAQADLFASNVASSIANGGQMLAGQILQWYVFALGETQSSGDERFRTHPYSVDRLRAAVLANKELAASLGVTVADVDKLVAEISGKDGGDEETTVAATDSDFDAVPDDAHESTVMSSASAAVSASGESDYLHPTEGEILALFQQVRESKAIQGNENYRMFASRIDCAVVGNQRVDACSAWERRKSGAKVPTIQYFSGHTIFDRVVGAIACKAFSKDGDENTNAVATLFIGVPLSLRENKFRITDELARKLLEMANVSEEDLADDEFREYSRIVSDGIALSTFSHEMGHFVLGHLGQSDDSSTKKEFSRAQEEQADSFATQVMAVAETDDDRQQIFLGRFLWGWVFAYAEAGASDEENDHPAARRRLRNLIEGNPTTAKELGITFEVVDEMLDKLQSAFDEDSDEDSAEGEDAPAAQQAGELVDAKQSQEPSSTYESQTDAVLPSEGPRRFAVLVGVGHSPGSPPLLDAPGKNVRLMYSLLKGSGGFDADHIVVLEEENATCKAVRKAVSNAVAFARPGDSFVFYFSGHGCVWGANNQNSLCTYSEDPKDVGYTDDDLNTDFSCFSSDVNVVGILQACHSGGVMSEHGNGNAAQWDPRSFVASVARIRSESKNENAVPVAPIGWITSSDTDRGSWGGTKGSTFTIRFIEGIANGDCDVNRDGLATFAEAWRYARDRLAELPEKDQVGEDQEYNSRPLCSDEELCDKIRIPIPKKKEAR